MCVRLGDFQQMYKLQFDTAQNIPYSKNNEKRKPFL